MTRRRSSQVSAMEIAQAREHGQHLAVMAAFRVLAHQVARLAAPSRTDHWFMALGEDAFNYVDRATHPHFDEETTRTIREAAYGTLQVIFDPSRLEG
jgi:hypothetical protein